MKKLESKSTAGKEPDALATKFETFFQTECTSLANALKEEGIDTPHAKQLISNLFMVCCNI